MYGVAEEYDAAFGVGREVAKLVQCPLTRLLDSL